MPVNRCSFHTNNWVFKCWVFLLNSSEESPCIDSYLLCDLNLTQCLKLFCIFRCCCSRKINLFKNLFKICSCWCLCCLKQIPKWILLLTENFKKLILCSVKRNKIKNFHEKRFIYVVKIPQYVTKSNFSYWISWILDFFTECSFFVWFFFTSQCSKSTDICLIKIIY